MVRTDVWFPRTSSMGGMLAVRASNHAKYNGVLTSSFPVIGRVL